MLSEDTLGDVVELVVLRKKTEIHFCVVFALELFGMVLMQTWKKYISIVSFQNLTDQMSKNKRFWLTVHFSAYTQTCRMTPSTNCLMCAPFSLQCTVWTSLNRGLVLLFAHCKVNSYVHWHSFFSSHFNFAFKFYEKMSRQYGSPNALPWRDLPHHL